MMKHRGVPSLLILLLALGGIACPGLLPGSRRYKPASEREAAVHARAARGIFPQEVRREPEQYRERLIAWAGILKSHAITKENGTTVLRFDIEHRYFDWAESFGPHRARYFPSADGEGVFRSAWSMPLEAFDSVSQQVHDGDMLIVYGYPKELRGDVVGFFPTEYVRLIGAPLYDDTVLKYGRERNK